MNLADKADLCKALAFSYRLMLASVPLMEFALPRSSGALLEYYQKHIQEESGHELMVLADLKSAGITDVPMYFEAAQLAGSQYYLIAHGHPALLLGYMYALESTDRTMELVQALEVQHQMELTALRHHTQHDIMHRQDIEELIHSLPDALNRQVNWNFECTKKALAEVLNG